MTELEEKVKAKVNNLIDPETGLNFGEMGLIQSVKEIGDGIVQVDFVPTSPMCPIAFRFATDIREVAKQVEDVKKVKVYCHGHVMEAMINDVVNREEATKG